MTLPYRILPTRIDLFRELPPGTTGVEVGVQRGDFSAEILTTPVKKLYLVDCWCHQNGEYELDVADVSDEQHEENYQLVLARFTQEIEEGRVEVMKKTSIEAWWEFRDGGLAWAFLDAGHDYESVFSDLYFWNRRIKESGCIMLHDYTVQLAALRQGFGVVQAVHDFTRQFGWRIDAITDEQWPSVKLIRK